MQAVIKTGGKQYMVSAGDILRIEKIEAKEGDEIAFPEVLLVSGSDGIFVGTPVLPNASVRAKVLGHGLGKKVLIMKKKRRTGYKVKRGHRQPYTNLEIKEVKA